VRDLELLELAELRELRWEIARDTVGFEEDVPEAACGAEIGGDSAGQSRVRKLELL
jgi:hypothetical protein